MRKRPIKTTGWSTALVGVGACLAVSILLIAAALLHNGERGEQPDWIAMNAQVDRALLPLEQREAAGEAEREQAKQKQAEQEQAEKAAGKGAGQEQSKQVEAAGTGAGQEQAKQVEAAGTGTEKQQAEQVEAEKKQAEQNKPDKAAAGQEPAGGQQANAAQSAAGAKQETALTPSSEGKIDINHASAAELDALPGIGAAKAEAIVADRDRNGLFRNVEDLLRVKGIGPKLLDKMKSYIVLQP